jgi:hypothetical protein
MKPPKTSGQYLGWVRIAKLCDGYVTIARLRDGKFSTRDARLLNQIVGKVQRAVNKDLRALKSGTATTAQKRRLKKIFGS